MRKPLVIAAALCGAALLAVPVVVAQTDASVAVTPGRAPAFVRPDPQDARTVVTPGAADTLVNPGLRGRAPTRARGAPRFVLPGDAAGGTSVHPGSRPLVVYPEGEPGTLVSPGRRPVVIYPP